MAPAAGVGVREEDEWIANHFITTQKCKWKDPRISAALLHVPRPETILTLALNPEQDEQESDSRAWYCLLVCASKGASFSGDLGCRRAQEQQDPACRKTRKPPQLGLRCLHDGAPRPDLICNPKLSTAALTCIR